LHSRSASHDRDARTNSEKGAKAASLSTAQTASSRTAIARDYTRFKQAIRSGDLATVREILTIPGFDIHSASSNDSSSARFPKLSPLAYAASVAYSRNGKFAEIVELLKPLYSAAEQNAQFESALRYALNNGDDDAVAYLTQTLKVTL